MSPYNQNISEEGRIYGFLLATVVANDDEKHKGMVKLRLLSEGMENSILEGVKVMAPFAGSSYGTYALPEVGEQVVVGFFEGCVDRPFVLGSLYAAGDSMIADTVKTPKKPLVELEEKEEFIRITTGDTRVEIDGKNGTVHIWGQKEILLESGSTQLSMKSDGAVALKGENIEIKGSEVKVESSGSLNLKGAKTDLTGSIMDVKSNSLLTLKGSLIKLN